MLFDNLLNAFAVNEVKRAEFSSGLDLIDSSTVLRMLRELGRPQRIKLGADMAVMASEASYKAGWSDCLDYLENFIEVFVKPRLQGAIEPPRMDYGALDAAVWRNDLTQEEADAIRSGRKPEYQQFTGFKPPVKPQSA